MTTRTEAAFGGISLLTACVLCAAAIVGWSTPVSADPIPLPDGAVYRLTPESEYQHGCFPPCLCPVWVQSGVRGTFNLVRIGPDPDNVTWRYAVEDVNWTVPANEAGELLRVIGSGQYLVGE